jgi:phosphoribosylformylglycinamidine (FGAM) synthase-like enzyme
MTATSAGIRCSHSPRTPECCASIRDSGLGVALATDCNSRFALLDPYAGAQLALAEAYRNVAVTGAEPLAITDCLNFGSPEDPAIMWQFSEAVRGLVDGCQTLGTPVTAEKSASTTRRVLRRSCRRRSSAC